ncbi:MAG TPA: LuxR C-terminal-related transcriptional regulator [Rugosimonospora sp.]|nr:LuxR C-terminal-related transcriptional regulator [Rugosimonospora sp.]
MFSTSRASVLQPRRRRGAAAVRARAGILTQAARGLSNARIAAVLAIADGTVKRHLHNISASSAHSPVSTR